MANTNGKVITCKAAVVKQFKHITIETIQVDLPQKNEIRIKMVAVGVCHSDHVFKEGKIPDQPLPFVLGHEGAGIVESVGAGVDSVKPGDKVFTLFLPNCQQCKNCKGDLTNMCTDSWGNKEKHALMRNVGYDGKPRFTLNGEPLYHIAGCSSFSEYVVIPESSCVKVHPETRLEKACIMACGFTTGFASATNAINIKPGDTAAVWGLGGVGLAAVVGCKDKKASRIIGIDINSDKEDIARKMGITDFINPKEITKSVPEAINDLVSGGVDYALVCAANTKAMETAVMSTSFGGTTVIVGFGDHTLMSVSPMHMFYNRKIKGTVIGEYKVRTDLPKLVDRYLAGELPVDDFVTHTFKLDEIEKAFELMEKGERYNYCLLLYAIAGGFVHHLNMSDEIYFDKYTL